MAPAAAHLHDERALQTLLMQSPSLLPTRTQGTPRCAANFRIGSTASVDLLGVGVDGRIVLVECGRQEGRVGDRWAAPPWRSGPASGGRPTRSSTGPSPSGPVSPSSTRRPRSPGPVASAGIEDTFRSGVFDNLAAGRFHLILAVDVMSDEVPRQVVPT